MQVFAILAIVVVSAAAKGSGPYLPSGWRPSGPAFYLPTEVQKPAENLQDVILGSEASGSDALREYGPPKLEISVNQGLPDVAIEQNFVDAVVSSGEEVSSIVLGRVIEQSAENTGLQQTTEGQINVEVVYETAAPVEDISERSLNGEILAEINEEAIVIPTQVAQEVKSEILAEINEEATVIPTQVAQEVQSEILAEINEEATVIPTQVAQEVQSEILAEIIEKATTPIQEAATDATLDVRSEVKLDEELRNLEVIVPEVLANLENIVKSEIEINQQIADSSSQESSGPSEQVPEGFLEYGPPGFKEYGPPKEDLNVVAIQGLLGQASVETNEARRRRFSPKFKPVKKH